MSDEPAPPPTPLPAAPVQSPAVVALLSIVTFGIYALVWFYKFGRMIDAAGDFGINPKRWYHQLAGLFAFVVTIPVGIVHFFVYAHRIASATQVLAERAAHGAKLRWSFWLLPIPIVGVVHLARLQSAHNGMRARLEADRVEVERRRREAQEAMAQHALMEQIVQCPVCSHVITHRFRANEKTTVRCPACGYSAPFN